RGRAGAALVGLVDADDATFARRPERHCPRPRREDRVVAADARAVAGPEARAALAHDDLAAADRLAREDLDPEHLRVRVAAVAARAKSLLMSHLSPPLPSSPPASARLASSPRASWRRASSPQASWRPRSSRR